MVVAMDCSRRLLVCLDVLVWMTTRVTLDVCRPPSYQHHPEVSIPSLSPFSSFTRKRPGERSQDGLVTKAVTYQGDWGCVTIYVSLVAHHLISVPKSGDVHMVIMNLRYRCT